MAFVETSARFAEISDNIGIGKAIAKHLIHLVTSILGKASDFASATVGVYFGLSSASPEAGEFGGADSISGPDGLGSPLELAWVECDDVFILMVGSDVLQFNRHQFIFRDGGKIGTTYAYQKCDPIFRPINIG